MYLSEVWSGLEVHFWLLHCQNFQLMEELVNYYDTIFTNCSILAEESEWLVLIDFRVPHSKNRNMAEKKTEPSTSDSTFGRCERKRGTLQIDRGKRETRERERERERESKGNGTEHFRVADRAHAVYPMCPMASSRGACLSARRRNFFAFTGAAESHYYYIRLAARCRIANSRSSWLV